MVTVYDPTTKRGFSMAEACKYGVMDNRNYWEGTVSDLLSLSGDKGDDIPRLHNRLSAALMQTYITDAQYFHNEESRPGFARPLHGSIDTQASKVERIHGITTMFSRHVYIDESNTVVGLGYTRTLIVGNTGFVIRKYAPFHGCCMHWDDEIARMESIFRLTRLTSNESTQNRANH